MAMKTMLMQNFGVTNKEHYGMLWYFLQWSIHTLRFENSPFYSCRLALVSQPLSECEAGGDLVLIQTSFLFQWKFCLKNTSQHYNTIYTIKQEGSFCFIPPSQRSLHFNISFQLVYLKARPNTFGVTLILCASFVKRTRQILLFSRCLIHLVHTRARAVLSWPLSIFNYLAYSQILVNVISKACHVLAC